MSNILHSGLSGSQLHVPGYKQSSDPGTVGPGREWIDTSVSPPILKSRNAGDTDWDVVSVATASLATLAATAQSGTGSFTGSFVGSFAGINSTTGSLTGTFIGKATGSLTASLTGSVTDAATSSFSGQILLPASSGSTSGTAPSTFGGVVQMWVNVNTNELNYYAKGKWHSASFSS